MSAEHLTPWAKGKSGNPGGRPKLDPDVVRMARGYTKEAIECAAKILRNDEAKDGDRLRAVEILLDRGHGKPVQPIESNLDGLFGELSLEQRYALDAALALITGSTVAAAVDEQATHH